MPGLPQRKSIARVMLRWGCRVEPGEFRNYSESFTAMKRRGHVCYFEIKVCLLCVSVRSERRRNGRGLFGERGLCNVLLHVLLTFIK